MWEIPLSEYPGNNIWIVFEYSILFHFQQRNFDRLLAENKSLARTTRVHNGIIWKSGVNLVKIPQPAEYSGTSYIKKHFNFSTSTRLPVVAKTSLDEFQCPGLRDWWLGPLPLSAPPRPSRSTGHSEQLTRLPARLTPTCSRWKYQGWVDCKIHHQVKSGGTVQYCKIVCDKGEWRGPYCGQTRERLGGHYHHHNHWQGLQKLWWSQRKTKGKTVLLSERVFRHGCHLQAPVSGLQLREGHRLVPPGQVTLFLPHHIVIVTAEKS